MDGRGPGPSPLLFSSPSPLPLFSSSLIAFLPDCLTAFLSYCLIALLPHLTYPDFTPTPICTSPSHTGQTRHRKRESA